MEDLLSFTFFAFGVVGFVGWFLVWKALLGGEPLACRFLSPDASPPSAAGAAAVSSGGTVTAANWRKMQLVGCVLLPYAGRQVSGKIYDSGQASYYWSSTNLGGNFAMGVQFDASANVRANYDMYKGDGMSVRLVRTL